MIWKIGSKAGKEIRLNSLSSSAQMLTKAVSFIGLCRKCACPAHHRV